MATAADIAYDDGFDHGRDAAVLCCFGGSARRWPMFDDGDLYDAYQSGYGDGYASVDD